MCGKEVDTSCRRVCLCEMLARRILEIHIFSNFILQILNCAFHQRLSIESLEEYFRRREIRRKKYANSKNDANIIFHVLSPKLLLSPPDSLACKGHLSLCVGYQPVEGWWTWIDLKFWRFNKISYFFLFIFLYNYFVATTSTPPRYTFFLTSLSSLLSAYWKSYGGKDGRMIWNWRHIILIYLYNEYSNILFSQFH